MARIDDLLALRSKNTRQFDSEVWDFMDRLDIERTGCSRLQNLSPEELQRRLDDVALNIQYLDDGVLSHDNENHNDGWKSIWWWYRAHHWTKREFERRGIAPLPPPEVPAMPELNKAFYGVFSGGVELLVRLSKRQFLLPMLTKGAIRFAPAASYNDADLNDARADDEMGKTYSRPGQALRVTKLNGEPIEVLGDAAFTMRRAVETASGLIDQPYWMCSFSSDLDPRLLAEFGSSDPDEDAFLAIFNVSDFFQRALARLATNAPGATIATVRNDYFDPYNPPSGGLNAIRFKLLRYAYQREVRLTLDPGYGQTLAGGGAFFMEIGSIEDIAGVYAADGVKLAGAGPDSFFA